MNKLPKVITALCFSWSLSFPHPLPHRVSVAFICTLSVLTAIFPGEPALAGFIEAKDDERGDDNWCYKFTANRPPTFYWLDPFLSPNQQCQSTERKLLALWPCPYIGLRCCCCLITRVGFAWRHRAVLGIWWYLPVLDGIGIGLYLCLLTDNTRYWEWTTIDGATCNSSVWQYFLVNVVDISCSSSFITDSLLK